MSTARALQYFLAKKKEKEKEKRTTLLLFVSPRGRGSCVDGTEAEKKKRKPAFNEPRVPKRQIVCEGEGEENSLFLIRILGALIRIK